MRDNEFFTVRGYQLLEQHKKLLTPSLEDYLEMIIRSMHADGYVRVNTLARQLNVQPSSASKMISRLAKLELVEYKKYGVLKLTPKGAEIGRYLLWRHDVIMNFLTLLRGEDNYGIFVEAELIEHILGKSTVESMEKMVAFFNAEPSIDAKYKAFMPQLR
ncbi:MAG TPA: iron dependent repressor, metal binding and dimerization domain protein [Clostridia bacterium]|nr:iron dependent repressor, metal binding and dimerization domain protein [Clostridia bacterium]